MYLKLIALHVNINRGMQTHSIKKVYFKALWGVPAVVQPVKDPPLPRWHRFKTPPGNFHMPWVSPEKKERKRKVVT